MPDPILIGLTAATLVAVVALLLAERRRRRAMDKALDDVFERARDRGGAMSTAAKEVKRAVVSLESQKNLLSRRYDSFALLSCGHRVKVGGRRQLRSIDLPKTLACSECGKGRA